MEWLRHRFGRALTRREWGLAALLGILLLTGLIITSLLGDRLLGWANNAIDRRGWELVTSFIESLWFPVTLYGLLAVVWAATVHLLWPKTRVAIPAPDLHDHIPGGTQVSQALTQDQIAERQLFIERLRSAALRLEKNTHYNIPGSAAHQFNRYCQTPQAQETIQGEEMTGWVWRLLNGQFMALAMRCWDSEERSDALLPSSLSDDGIRDEVGRIAASVREYRQLIGEFIAFVQALERRGVPPEWENITWPDDLANDYDELMRLMGDLRNATPRNTRSGLPTDEQLSKFQTTEV